VLSPVHSKLLRQGNLKYLGAFRVPSTTFPGGGVNDNFMYSGTCLAFNYYGAGAAKTLFLVGNNNDIAEIQIAPPINSPNISDLNTAALLQWCGSPLPKLPTNPSGANTLGGLQVIGPTSLVGTAFVGYDATASAVLSHYYLDNLTLSAAKVTGLFEVGTQQAGLVAGYMCPLPGDWPVVLGGEYLTGQADVNILGRTSSGPACYSFRPYLFQTGQPSPATPLVNYPISHPLGVYGGFVDPLQSGIASVKGCVFVPNTDSVLFFGESGASLIGYGLANNWGMQGTAKGPSVLNGEWVSQVWAYNANDFRKAIAGDLQPWEVFPYDVWNPTFPNTTATRVGGVAFDPFTNRFYVSIINADVINGIFPFPLIQVYELDTNVSPDVPHIGTLSAMPVITPSGTDTAFPAFYGTYLGPVRAGDPVTLTAGNVFPGNQASEIGYVDFFGPKGWRRTGQQLTTDFLGTVWAATMPTAGLASGTHVCSASATDIAGRVSAIATWTLRIA
jgi:hypothetical protein